MEKIQSSALAGKGSDSRRVLLLIAGEAERVACKDVVDPVLRCRGGLVELRVPDPPNRRDSILVSWLAILPRLREVRSSNSSDSECWNRFSSLPRASAVTFPYWATSSTLPWRTSAFFKCCTSRSLLNPCQIMLKQVVMFNLPSGGT